MSFKKLERLKRKINEVKLHNHLLMHVQSKKETHFLTISIELISGIIVGLLLGLFLDNLFNSRGLWVIICVTFSLIAAFRNIWRKLRNNNEK